MGRIRILPDRVANQIAAGEVIERPVAVVKELVENSLDAGARRIEVEFRKGGKRYIRVEDDGSGMSPDEAMLSLERHATSKIQVAEDLNTVRSFGFRGEALPSIASVSQFRMATRPMEYKEGSEIQVNGGKILSQKACGMPLGTRVEVEHLFHPVPARRKFLKTDPTESAHIVQMIRWFAVAHPERAFTLLEDGRVVFQSPPCDTLRDRVQEIWGKALAEHLLDFQMENDTLQIQGLLGQPGFSRATRHEMVCLVNQRPVESRTLNYAILEAYHTSIPKGRYPVVFLSFSIDPSRIDVNVHPAKREIRFREESKVRQAILGSILERLRAEKELRLRPLSREGQDEVTAATGIERGGEGNSSPPVPRPPFNLVKRPGSKGISSPATPPRETPQSPVPPPDSVVLSKRLPFQLNWRYLGQMVHGLILFETGKGLVLLDPVAAKSRIHYEAVQDHFQAEVSARQPLLLPITLDLEPVPASCLEENLVFLNRNGFEVEPFGRDFYRVTALPPWLDPGEGEQYLRDLIDQVRQRGLKLEQEEPELAHKALARLATQRRGFRDTGEQSSGEYLRLAESLLQCRDPYTDPGGRSTFVELSRGELDRRLGRG